MLILIMYVIAFDTMYSTNKKFRLGLFVGFNHFRENYDI